MFGLKLTINRLPKQSYFYKTEFSGKNLMCKHTFKRNQTCHKTEFGAAPQKENPNMVKSYIQAG